jgi:hypothetical protein
LVLLERAGQQQLARCPAVRHASVQVLRRENSSRSPD